MASITSKGIDIEKKEILQGYGKPPPEGLIPVGDSGIYLSPNVANDKPVSPFDCEQWPDSPYCGGVPWTRTPIGFDLDFGFDGCGAWVQGTPVIGFTKLPQISAAWRRPGECRNQSQPEVKSPEVDLEKVGTPADFSSLSYLPKDVDIICFFCYDTIDLNWNQTTTESFKSYSCPGDYNVSFQTYPISKSIATIYYSSSKETQITNPDNSSSTVVEEGNFMQNIHPNHLPFKDFTKTYSFKCASITHNISPLDRILQDDSSNPLITRIAIGKLGDIEAYFGTRKLIYGRVFPDGEIKEPTGWTNCKLVAAHVIGWGSQPPKAPPPDYRKRKCDCMQCCGSGQAQDRRRDQDNAELLKYLKRIDKNLGQFPIKVNIFDADETKEGAQAKSESLANAAQSLQRTIHEIEKALKCIGIDQLPVFTPSSIIDDESNGILGDLGDLKNQIFKQKIESLAELALWDIKNKYEIFGKWQEVITIEDTDPTKKGNQPKKIVLPNMARTFRELMLLNSIQVKTLGMLFDVSLKMYIDLANTKISTAVSEAILRDIQDYLDYPTEIKKLDVPLGISIPSDSTPNDDKEDLERFLRNSTAKAKFDDWTGEGSMTEMLVTLLRAAESIIGQNYEKLQ